MSFSKRERFGTLIMRNMNVPDFPTLPTVHRSYPFIVPNRESVLRTSSNINGLETLRNSQERTCERLETLGTIGLEDHVRASKTKRITVVKKKIFKINTIESVES